MNPIETFDAAAVGVPEMTPLDAAKDRPAGNVPLVMLQEYGLVPPVAASAALYGAVTTPLGRDVVVIFKAAGATVIVSAAVLVLAGDCESVTAKVIDELDTAAVGVPDITPVEAASDRPAGRAPALMVQE